MAKSFEYELGGKTRTFKYDMDAREVLEDRYDLGLQEILQRKVLGASGDGTLRGGLFKAQVALVWLGIRHHGPAITEKKVRDWMLAEVTDKDQLFDLLTVACNAVYASGVLGLKYEEPEDADAGKEGAAEPAA